MSCRINGNKKHIFINRISTFQFVGWWVGFGCGWVKLNVLQKRWLVCRLAALLILRSVGILSTVFLSVYGSSVGRPTLAPNGSLSKNCELQSNIVNKRVIYI